MGYAWPGFRRVRHQVCKRIGRRLQELHLADFEAYRRHLASNPSEWHVLDGFCWIPISRFARDWAVFECLGREVLPSLCEAAAARGSGRIECWSVGCARGEEPYTLAAVWEFIVAPSWPRLSISILATEIDRAQIDRANVGLFKESSLRETPPSWRDRMFEGAAGEYRVRPPFRETVRFVVQDVRQEVPATMFDLILCRNLALTYFDDSVRHQVMSRLIGSLRQGGALVIGARERLPADICGIAPWIEGIGIYQRTDTRQALRSAAA